jgi:hypothetical protein
VQPIESHATLGVPDVFLCSAGIDAWIELKVVLDSSVLRGRVTPHFRPKQLEWLHDYAGAGGVALLLVFYEMEEDGCRIVNAFQGSNIRREYDVKSFNALSSMHCRMEDVTRGMMHDVLLHAR